MKKTIFIVGYGDMECYNQMAVFSTKEAAEEFLKPYYELERLYGKDCVSMFYPSINEVEIDFVETKLQFYRSIRKYEDEDGNTQYLNNIRRVDYISLEHLLKNSSTYRYNTITLDEAKSLEEAKEYFKQAI